MEPQAPVSFADLIAAFDWVSGGHPMENEAFVSRETGAVHWTSSMMGDLDEDVPEDIDDDTRYLAVPHKNDLNLGRNLALTFTREQLPDSYSVADDFFRQRGAYGRFKTLLERKGLLDAWHKYEENAVESALREWSEENGLQLKP
jgi:hypothetical protein